MKKFLVTACAVCALLWVGNAWGLTITYTADNITDTWYIQGESGIAQNLAAGSNRADWRYADTEILNLSPGSHFSFIWSVTNFGEYSESNPAGFLAQIDLGNDEIIVTDTSWLYSVNGYDTSDFYSGAWSWGNVTEHGNNGGGNIWTNVLNQQLGISQVAGISSDAQWIWSANNFGDGVDKNLWIRVDVQTAPVPEPSALLLFGSGLIGLALYRRRKMDN